MNRRLFLGFSLAEVMIALAVVGIIAAMTVPVVISNHQRQVMVTQVQKIYSDFGQALTILEAENLSKGLFASVLNKKDGKTIAQTAGVFLVGDADNKPYFQVKRDCGTTAQPCFAASYKTIGNTSVATAFSCENGYNVTFPSGSAVCIIPAEIDADTRGETANPATVYIDVNGAEEPNIAGRDLFTFNIYNDYTVDEVDPASANKEAQRTTIMDTCTTSAVGAGCFSKLLNDNWKMNY